MQSFSYFEKDGGSEIRRYQFVRFNCRPKCCAAPNRLA